MPQPICIWQTRFTAQPESVISSPLVQINPPSVSPSSQRPDRATKAKCRSSLLPASLAAGKQVNTTARSRQNDRPLPRPRRARRCLCYLPTPSVALPLAVLQTVNGSATLRVKFTSIKAAQHSRHQIWIHVSRKSWGMYYKSLTRFQKIYCTSPS